MIYLLDGTEFQPMINYVGVAISIEAKFNMSDIIYNKLKLASETNQLIHTQWLRGIGKTYCLIQYAKRNNLTVLEANRNQASKIRLYEKYDKVYSSDIPTLKGQKDIKDVVIDEGVTNIQELKDNGFNIITGFYTPKKEDNMSFNERVLKTLMDEIEALTPKIQKTRENNEFGTYKNMINAYREVLNLIQSTTKEMGNNIGESLKGIYK